MVPCSLMKLTDWETETTKERPRPSRHLPEKAPGKSRHFPFLSVRKRVLEILSRRYTIMIIPHSDRKPVHLQINLFLMGFISFFAAVLLIGFIIFATSYSGTQQRSIENSSALSRTRGNLDAILDEVRDLMKVYQLFEGTMNGTLKELNIQPGSQDSNGQHGGGDLSRLTGPTEEASSQDVRELVDLKRLNQSLSGSLVPLSEIGDVLKAQKKLLADIPDIWPIEGSHSAITMEFGPNIHPFTNMWYIHKGVDIGAPYGLPVLAAANGKVVEAAYDALSGYGLSVIIEHKYGFRTRYGHMSTIVVKPGQEVAQGQRIGAVGSTGVSTGPHLHFEIEIGTQVLDPTGFLKIHSDSTSWEGNR